MFTFEDIPLSLFIVGGFMAVTLAIVLFAKLEAALIAVGTMSFVAATALNQNDLGIQKRLWLYPMQANRSLIYLVLGIMLFATVIGQSHRVSGSKWSAQGIALLLLGLYASVIRGVHDNLFSAAESFMFACVTIVPLIMVLPALMRDRNGVMNMIRTLAFINLGWIAGVVVQFGVNFKQMLVPPDDRFVGLTANPQSAAIYLTVAAVIALWLVLHDTNRRFWFVWIASFGITLIFLLWTGSRTGLGMFVIGVGAIIYTRVGKLALVAPIVLIALNFIWSFLSTNLGMAGVEHLTSLENTRGDAWAALWELSQESPLVGVGAENTLATENSFLYSFAAYGVGMFVLVIVLALVSIAVCMRLFRLRWSLPAFERGVVDLTIAFNLMYFAGATFEGYIVSRVSSHLIFMLIFAAMATYLLNLTPEEIWELEEQSAASEREAEEHEDAIDADVDYGDYGDFSDYGDYGDYDDAPRPA